MFKHRLMPLLAAFVVPGAFAAPAGAAVVTLESTASNFGNTVNGGLIDTYHDYDGLPGFDYMRFGFPAGGFGSTGQKSSLGFYTAASQTILAGAQFTLGTLSHFNAALAAGTSITQTELSLTANFTVDGVAVSSLPLTFTIALQETPNSGLAANCPFMSVVPCSDRVLISGSFAPVALTVGGATLTFMLDGFLDAQDQISTALVAQEGDFLETRLVGHFTLAEAPLPTPEPAAWATMALGFGVVGHTLRRRNTKRPAGGRPAGRDESKATLPIQN